MLRRLNGMEARMKRKQKYVEWNEIERSLTKLELDAPRSSFTKRFKFNMEIWWMALTHIFQRKWHDRTKR